jgi:hypothetical protein
MDSSYATNQGLNLILMTMVAIHVGLAPGIENQKGIISNQPNSGTVGIVVYMFSQFQIISERFSHVCLFRNSFKRIRLNNKKSSLKTSDILVDPWLHGSLNGEDVFSTSKFLGVPTCSKKP